MTEDNNGIADASQERREEVPDVDDIRQIIETAEMKYDVYFYLAINHQNDPGGERASGEVSEIDLDKFDAFLEKYPYEFQENLERAREHPRRHLNIRTFRKDGKYVVYYDIDSNRSGQAFPIIARDLGITKREGSEIRLSGEEAIAPKNNIARETWEGTTQTGKQLTVSVRHLTRIDTGNSLRYIDNVIMNE